MAIHCPNKSSADYKRLVEATNESTAKLLWIQYDGEVPSTFYEKTVPEEGAVTPKSLSNLKTSDTAESIFTYADMFLDNNIKVESDDTVLQGSGLNILNGFTTGMNIPTVSQVLDNISNISETSPLALNLINKARNIIAKTGTTVKFATDKEMGGEDNYMRFNADTNEIYISRSKLATSTEKAAAMGFLHEVAHAKTVNALKSPATPEEVDFNNIVTQFYNKYKRSSLQNEYGFKDKFEFVAELYSNPEFADAVDRLDQSWFKNFIDALRRMFVSGNPREYNVLFNQVVRFVEERNETYRPFDSVFNTTTPTLKGDLQLDTLTKRIDYTVTKVKDAVQHSFNKFKNATGKGQERAESLKQLNKKLEEFGKAKKWHAILEYVKDFKNTVELLDNRLQKLLNDAKYEYNGQEYVFRKGMFKLENEPFIQHSAMINKITDPEVMKQVQEQIAKGEVVVNDELYDNILKSAKVPNITADKIYEFEDQLAVYDTLNDIEKLIDDARANINELGTEDRIIRNEVKGVIDLYRGKHEGLSNTLNELKRKAVVDVLAQPYYNTKVETDWRNKLYKEYEAKGITGETKDQYVSRMLSTTYKPEYTQDLRDAAVKLANDPSFDISAYELHAADNLNIKSRLVQIASNMVMSMRDRIQNYMKNVDLDLAKIHKDFMKSKSSKLSEAFKNIIEQDANGNYYLKTLYSTKFRDNRNKVLNDIKNDVDGTRKTFSLTDKALETLKEKGSNVTARLEDSYKFKEGDELKVLSDVNLTGDNVNIGTIHKFAKYSEISEDEKQAIASILGYSSFEDLLNSAAPNSVVLRYTKGETPLDLVEYHLSENKSKADKGYVYKTDTFKQWQKENTVVVKGRRIPSSIYKNSLGSKEEIELTKKFIAITKLAHEQTHGIDSLISTTPVGKNRRDDITYYKIPSKIKSDTERILEGQIKGVITDNLSDFTKVKADEIGHERLDSGGNPLKSVKVHFRGHVRPEDQSLDLFSIYRNEAWNGFNYAMKKNSENTFKLLVDIAKNKKYYNMSKRSGKQLFNIFSTNKTPETISGEFSNELQKLQGIAETNIYDILNEHAGTIAGADVNKLSNSISSLAATSMLAGNIFSATANLTNGYSQLIFNALGGKNFNMKSLVKAEKMIDADLPAIMLDLANPIKTSFTNQVIELFDMTNSYGFQIQDFVKDTATKALLDKHNLGALNNMGEFKMAGMLTMSILNDLKVMNENHQYIDKLGNVVSEDKAASLLDMLSKDKTGKLVINEKVAFTKQNPTVNIHHGGKVAVNSLIRKRSHDMFGVYSNELAPEIQKKFYGKLIMMFKKFLLPGLQARYKGLTTAGKLQSELGEQDQFYSDAEKDYIEGYYTTFTRMAVQVMRNHSLNYTRDYFNQLSDYEKANLKKATSELVLSMVILPLLGGLIGAAGDDDDDLTMFLLYQNMRLENELQSFYNPLETYKTLSNPFAGLSYVKNVTRVALDIAQPVKVFTKEGESHFDYINVDSRGNNILWKHTKKALPLVNQFDKHTKDLIKSFNRG